MSETGPAPAGLSSFSLEFPAELKASQVTDWLVSLSGLLPGLLLRVFGAPAVVLELWADQEHGMRYRLSAPPARAGYVVSQLRTAVPGIRVSPIGERRPHAWSAVAELGMRRTRRSLRIEPEAVAASLLASVQGFSLHRGETIAVQCIIRPAVPERLPEPAKPDSIAGLLRGSGGGKDAVADARTKLMAVNFLAAIRIGVVARDRKRAEVLLSGVRTAFQGTRSVGNRLQVRSSGVRLGRLLDEGRAPFLFAVQLTAGELAGLLAWPVGSPHVAGLRTARSRQLPPSGAIPRTGLVVGKASFPGASRPLAIAPAELCKHLQVVGPTGVGKTVLLGNLVAQAMRAGHPVIVMERKGDLFRSALDAVPRERLDDVIVLDVSDSQAVGYNLLSEGNPRLAVEEICQLFEFLYPDMRRGIWARAALHRGLSTLITRRGSAFIDLVPLLSPGSRSPVEQQWRDELVAEVQDPELKRFWERFDGLSPAQQENYAAPILDRAWQLNERPEIRNVIGQSTSSFTMREAMSSGKVLLVSLAGLGVETGRLAGTLLLNAIWSAVRAGACDPGKPTLLFLDEFQDFLNLPVDAESLLVQARSFGLAMVLAHQHLDQLPDAVRAAVLANARSKVVFQTAYDDARVFAREFGRTVTDEDFMNLERFEVLVRLATSEGISPPASAVTTRPGAPTGLASEARDRSRGRYGRTPEEIAQDIAARRTPRRPPEPKKSPRVGGVRWE